MRTLKRFAANLFSAVILLSVFYTAAYAQLDLAKWNEAQMYMVLEDGTESNSSVDCIILKTIHDSEVHQLHMLFMFEQKSFNDDANTGVRMNFDGFGTVELHSDGTTEYDDEIFFAEIDGVYSNAKSKAVYIEVTLGIKSGIPDVLTMDFNLYDTDGVATNTYSVDICGETETDAEVEDESTSKTSKTKTTKKKTTKKKTTKKKTTKRKTSKSKTSKSKKAKTDSDEDYDIEETSQNISLAEKEIAASSDRNTIIIACTVAVVICTAAACAVSIINSRKGKDNNRQG